MIMVTNYEIGCSNNRPLTVSGISGTCASQEAQGHLGTHLGTPMLHSQHYG